MTRAIASCALAGALLWACAEKKEAPRAPERARPLQALPPAGIPKAAPPELPGARRSVPSSAEAELALTLGKALLEDAKPEEAEVQLKVAAAGGRPGADELLLKVQSELEAKRRLADARRKFEARDWPGATEALAGVAPESSLRARADENRRRDRRGQSRGVGEDEAPHGEGAGQGQRARRPNAGRGEGFSGLASHDASLKAR